MIRFLLIPFFILFLCDDAFTCYKDEGKYTCQFHADLSKKDRSEIREIQNNIDYDSYNFRSPLDIPSVLAANFGELRSNHFHTGLDFKTNRREGYNIYSVEDGYVSRIKVSPWGYGHVVYIDHYNGLTSVYAHCSYFKGELAGLAEQQQKKNQRFEIDYYPAKDSLKVKKGQVIALSGNTGGSTAPHLHFEIRDTKSEHPLNPLLFGFGVTDNVKPEIRGGRVYSLSKEGYRIPNMHKDFSIYGSNGKFSISGNKLTINSDYVHKDGGIGFAFDAIDRLDAANNVCGIHEAILIVDGDTIYHQNMRKVTFPANRFINAHKDYEAYHQRRKHLQKTFKVAHNPLPIYEIAKDLGVIKIKPGDSKKIQYSCLDVHGNKSNLFFDLEVQDGEINKEIPFNHAAQKYLTPDSAYMKIEDDYSILFPPKLVYEPTPLILKKDNNMLYFGNARVPLQDDYRIMLKLEPHQNLPKEKYYVERTSHTNRSYFEGGTVKDDWITTWTKSFGSFQIKHDTIPPSIIYKNFRDGQKIKASQLIWKFKDNATGIKYYRLFVDGEYHVLKYEYKKGGKYYFEVPADFQGKKELKVEVVDACGNVKEEEYEVVF